MALVLGAKPIKINTIILLNDVINCRLDIDVAEGRNRESINFKFFTISCLREYFSEKLSSFTIN